MLVMMRLASGATAARDRQILREAKAGILGNAINFPFPEIGEVWGKPDLSDAFRAPIRTDVRTLFISGTLDSNCPIRQVEEIRATFSRSTHLLVQNAGHEDMLVNPDVQAAVLQFLQGQEVSRVRIALPAPKFVPIPARSAAR